MARSRIADVRGPEFPARLDAGESLTVTLDLIKPSYAYIPDEPPQGFATDTSRRWTMGEAEDHLRRPAGDLR